MSVVLILAVLLVPAPQGSAATLAAELLNNVDDLYRGKSATGRMTMEVHTEHWARALTMTYWTRGKDKSLVRIVAPAKEKGTATLRSGNNIWNYLPKVKRVVKVPTSMMGGSWMGSHFTNDDLVKQSRMAEDFTSTITFSGQRDGREIIEITCLPHDDAAVVWGKVTVEVLAQSHLPVRSRYFDEDMALARTLVFADVGHIGGRPLPMRLRMVPEDKPEEFTEVRYQSIAFDVDLPDDTFSLRELQR